MRINHSQFNINFPARIEGSKSDKISCGEFFAGGGGWTEGNEKIEEVETVWILNHDKVAIKTNAHHHKNVKVYWADIYAQDEHDLEPVDYVHASVECTQHSGANAGKNKKIGSYTMAWELNRYLVFLKPLVISIENVPEFKKWAPVDENDEPIKERQGEEFERWKQAVMDMGYEYSESIRNAADDGLPTRRVRLFCFFYRKGIDITFPEYTHSKTGDKGKAKWVACREHIDTSDEGISIFGRQFNTSLRKNLRKPLVYNSLRRIAGGIRKYHPEFYQFLCHFHGGENQNRFQTLLDPINTIDCSNRHQLITVEKLQFIMDYCRADSYQTLDHPMNTQLTWQTKTLVNMEMDFSNFICQFYGGSDQHQDLNGPINTITTKDRHQLIRIEKVQFIATYFNSNGNPESNISNLDEPLPTVMTKEHHQLITLLDNFDIKARFLRPDELAGCSTFPRDYFSQPGLKLSNKNAVRLIGNAVPPEWAPILVGPNIATIKKYKSNLILQ